MIISKKYKQFILVYPPTYTALSKELLFFQSVFSLIPHLALYRDKIPQEANILKLLNKLLKGKQRVLARLFKLKEKKGIL